MAKVTKEIISFDKKSITWTVKQIVNMMDNEKICFDNAVQRSYIWKPDQKSLLIHSLLISMPVPHMFAVRTGDKVYDFLDGKQRCNAVSDFVKNRYELTNVPPVEYTDGSSVDINGMQFSDLPEDMQDNILSYTLTINYFDDLTEEQQEDMFFRLNAGTDLSAIEKSRVKCPSLNEIQQITKYPLFDYMTERQRERYTDEDIVVKMIAMLVMDEPCLDTKEIRPFMETLEVTKAIKDRMYKVTKAIKEMHDELETDELPKIAKRLYVKTHMISLVPFVEKHGVQTEFVKQFFGSGRMTISKKYNDHASNGSGHVQNVKARTEALEEEFKKFMQH